MDDNALIVIPARMGSSRFPGKPLAMIKGRPLLERVWRIAKTATEATAVVIATDNAEIENAARGFGADVVRTSESCRTGTDRVAEVAAMPRYPFSMYFSLQGDAVLTPPWVIDAVLRVMRQDPAIGIATPAVALEGEARSHFVAEKRKGSSSGTCVVFDAAGKALYFSKGLVPWYRDGQIGMLHRHIGLYGYRRAALQQFAALPPGRLEEIEKLEQLRALEYGMQIQVVEVDMRLRTHGSIDRPEDIAVVEAVIEREGELCTW